MSKKAKIWLAVGIVVVIGLAVGYYFWNKSKSPEKKEGTRVEAEPSEEINSMDVGEIAGQ